MKKIIILLCIVTFMSCKIKNVTGKHYSYKSENRELQLIFENDTICKFINIFNCDDIDPNYKEITFTCKYIQLDDMVYVKNIDEPTEKDNLIFYVPPQESEKCYFLKEKYRKNTNTIGANWLTLYEKFGVIPNIDEETLFIIKNKILFYKQNDRQSIIFIFK